MSKSEYLLSGYLNTPQDMGLFIMENSFKYFKNEDCPFFPCHSVSGDFNCLFCYCPLFHLEDCGGVYEYVGANSNVKSCAKCNLPHEPWFYDYIIKRIQ